MSCLKGPFGETKGFSEDKNKIYSVFPNRNEIRYYHGVSVQDTPDPDPDPGLEKVPDPVDPDTDIFNTITWSTIIF